MTGRERLRAVLRRQPTDRLCWMALVDGTTRSAMAAAAREMPIVDFYRHVGCDILCFGNMGLPEDTRFVPPCRRVTPEVDATWETGRDGSRRLVTTTPWGTLTATFRQGHPVGHPVTTPAELEVLKSIWLNSRYEEVQGSAGSYEAILRILGDDGLFAQTLAPSPVQQLLQYDMGVANFYALLQDVPDAMEDLLGIMHRRRCEEYEITASRSPAEVVISVENTSINLISPALYRRYSLAHLRGFVETMHRGGKTAILHMCGFLRDLLPDIRRTGLDGVHALTPPPIGDTPWDEAFDVLGDDCIVMGTLGADVLTAGRASPGPIREALDRWVTPRVRRSPFVLMACADGIPLPVEPFYAVRDWVEAGVNGHRF